ncbi:MAG: hypothetical protein K1000chlam2_01492, partial [Chlamydiae bacterium]|nr:hypothetical protein [Chlamydiota bacterium]
MSRKDLNHKVGEFIIPVSTRFFFNQTVGEALIDIHKNNNAWKILYLYVLVGHKKNRVGVYTNHTVLNTSILHIVYMST